MENIFLFDKRKMKLYYEIRLEAEDKKNMFKNTIAIIICGIIRPDAWGTS